jgi:selenide,water dikinase
MEEIIFDPQTSGGLLVAIPAEQADALVAELQAANVKAADIGTIVPREEKEIIIYK